MKDILDESYKYIVCLYNVIPTYIFEGLIFLFCLGSVFLLAFVGVRHGLRYILELLMAEYCILLLCSTVIFRTVNETQHFNPHPFWSYAAVCEGRHELIVENIMNIFAFMPNNHNN